MKRMRLLTILVACLFTVATGSVAFADDTSIKDQIDQMQKQIDALKAQLNKQEAAAAQAAAAQAAAAQAAAAEAKKAEAARAKEASSFLQRKPGDAVTFVTPHSGEVTVYGNLDVSFDYTTKGLQSDYGDNGGVPVGNMGWQPAIASNLSYLGLRGKQPLSDRLRFRLAARGGDRHLRHSRHQTDDVEHQRRRSTARCFPATASSDSPGKGWGSLEIGKRETPYKKSTDRLNPFSAMIGDYRVIMGNTGGDNRVEFGLRAPHAIWYESPNWSGFSLEAMYAPGQNRDDTSSIVPSAEPDCSGGNIPGSGALPPTCNDGSFGDLYSARACVFQGPLLRDGGLRDAQERESNERSARPRPRTTSATRAPSRSERNTRSRRRPRSAPSGSARSASLPSDLEYQNERTRDNATWLAITQVLSRARQRQLRLGACRKRRRATRDSTTRRVEPIRTTRRTCTTFAWRHSHRKRRSPSISTGRSRTITRTRTTTSAPEATA